MKNLISILVLMCSSFLCSQSIINDSFLDYKSSGIVHGGIFSDSGYVTTDEYSYIQYNTKTISSGTIEFDVKGIYASKQVFPNCQINYKDGNKNCSEEDIHYQIFNIWDRDENNSYWGVTQWHNKDKAIIHVYGYVTNDIYKWNYLKFRLNVNSLDGGYEDSAFAFEDPVIGPINWERNKIYHFKLVWGDGHFLLHINNELKKDWDYSSFGCEYAPPFMSMRIGSAIGAIKSGGFKCPVGITYSNFKVYENEDVLVLPEVTDIESTKEEGNVSVTSDFIVSFNKLMNLESFRSNLSISPSFDYELKQIGNSIFIRNKGVLKDNTTYNLVVGKNTSDGENSIGLDCSYEFKTNKAYPDTLYMYESHDFPITIQGMNYRTVIASNFVNGDRTITLDGFWDGYSIGKVRFTPDKLGIWNYSINGITGTFICVNSNSKGFIKTNGTKFQCGNQEWKFIGNTSWRGYTSLMPYNSRWKELINLCSAHSYTAVQSIIHSYINGNAFWSNEGGQCFSGTEPNYDDLNPEYFRWVDKRINYMLSKDIVPVIFLSWTQDYGNFTSVQFERYVKYIVSRYAAKNVIWIICGEYSELPNDFTGRTTDEFNTWGMLVHQKDPYNHPTSLHPTGRSTSAEFANTVWMDFIGQQTPYVNDIARDLVYGKPVVNLEPRYYYPAEFQPEVPNTEVIKQLYETVKNGGYYTAGFYTYFAPDKGGWDLSLLPDEQRWTKNLNKSVITNFLPSLEEITNLQNSVPNKVTNLRIIK